MDIERSRIGMRDRTSVFTPLLKRRGEAKSTLSDVDRKEETGSEGRNEGRNNCYLV